jgi:ABC-type multidrug transport system fused ATPase/permease subunit
MSKYVPLKATFMLAAIFGFLISGYMITELSWKVTMLIFFSTMFIAAFISMTHAPIPVKLKK